LFHSVDVSLDGEVSVKLWKSFGSRLQTPWRRFALSAGTFVNYFDTVGI